MDGDEYSLNRLLSKIEGYLGYIQSVHFREECGPPSVENTTIVVHVHSQSGQEVFDLLHQNSAWVASNDATLIIVPINGATALN